MNTFFNAFQITASDTDTVYADPADARSMAQAELEEKLQSAVFPRYGYTTAQKFESADEYETFLNELLEEELAEYASDYAVWLKNAEAELEEQA
jgi:hypothetical protein